VAAAQEFMRELPEYDGWYKWNRHYWHADFPGFLRFFFAQCFTEPDSAEQIEHFYGMGMQTTAEVLLATAGTDDQNLGPTLAVDYCKSIRCPALVIHGDADAITPLQRGLELARLTSADLVVNPGGGHEPQCRYPESTKQVIRDFLDRAL